QGRIAVITGPHHPEIEADDVAILEHPLGRRHAVHDLLVDRGTQRRRVDATSDIVAFEGGNCTALARLLLGQAVEVGGRDAGTYLLAEPRQNLGDDAAGGADQRDLLRAAQDDHAAPWSRAEMTRPKTSAVEPVPSTSRNTPRLA